MPEVIAHIQQARDSGVDITADTYAYPAGFNTFSAIIPPWAHDGGDAKLIERLKDPAMRARIRKEMETPGGNWENEWQEVTGPEGILVGAVAESQAAAPAGQDHRGNREDLGQGPVRHHLRPADRGSGLHQRGHLHHVRARHRAGAPAAVGFDLQRFGRHRARWSAGPGASRIPRAYGTFPRILRKYVREEKKLTLPDAIRKFSALPAQRMRLADRGVLKEGMWADVVIFDPDTIRDVATFANPNQLSEGMRFVLVNGVPVIEDGKMTNALPGKVLRGPGRIVGRAILPAAGF